MRKIKLQYYLRGLGVGILITAVIMGVALPGEEQTLTDAQIKEKALALGMVDGNSLVLSDLQQTHQTEKEFGDETLPLETEENKETGENNLEETVGSQETEDATMDEVSTDEMEYSEETEVQPTVEAPTEEEPTEDDAAVEEPPTEEVQQPEESSVSEDFTSQPRVTGELNAEGNTVTIEIRSGANSYSVSRVLAEYGVVADAKSFDNFLCNAGYSKKIHTGKYLIAIGTGEEEIAKIITGNR